MPESIYYLNNRFLPASKAFLHVSDLAIMRGYGVFDFLVTYKQKPFLLKEHLKRLARSAEIIDLPLPFSLSAIEKIVFKTLAKNSLKSEKTIRIIVTGGKASAPGFTFAKGKTATLIVTVDKKHTYPKACYEHGVKVITFSHCQPFAQAKTLGYTIGIKALKIARQQGAIEAVYCCRGKITEGVTSNLFAVLKNKIVTPKNHILRGITRNLVLQLAKEIASVEERNISLEEIPNFQEAFLTSSSKGVMPIVQIDQYRICQGKTVGPGLTTQKIMAVFHKYVWGI